MDYLYDGTFEGLLTCVHHHYYTGKATGIYTQDNYQMNLMNSFMEVATDENKSDTVYDALENKISHFAVTEIYKTFLSDFEDKEMRILNFAVLGFKTGPKVTLMHNNDAVIAVREAASRVGNEAERMRQFVRFRELANGVMYGQIEPEHDVTELLAPHFCDRFRNEPFIIHDVSRNKALVSYKMNWYITDFSAQEMPPLSQNQTQYEALWQNYFDSISIKQRINPRCQRNFVPMRYRKHLTEFLKN